MSEDLIKIGHIHPRIKPLSFYKRIEIEYPILTTKTISEMLIKAVNKLPKDMFLQIDGGYRSTKTQRKLWFNKIKELGKEKATQLVGNPFTTNIPGHCVGGAVDVSLLDRKMKEINLSAPFKNYYDQQKLYSNKISEESQKLRLVLYNAMVTSGFAPHPNEYWHFSYGDRRWAKYYNKKAIYKKELSAVNHKYNPVVIIFIKVIIRVRKLIVKTISKISSYFFRDTKVTDPSLP